MTAVQPSATDLDLEMRAIARAAREAAGVLARAPAAQKTAALQNAAQNIQVHGAIGFTAEADAHLFIKRAHVLEQLWGDTRQQRRLMLAAPFPDG